MSENAPVVVEDIFIEGRVMSPSCWLELHELRSVETGQAVEYVIKLASYETVETVVTYNADYFRLETCQAALELFVLAALTEGSN